MLKSGYTSITILYYYITIHLSEKSEKIYRVGINTSRPPYLNRQIESHLLFIYCLFVYLPLTIE